MFRATSFQLISPSIVFVSISLVLCVFNYALFVGVTKLKGSCEIDELRSRHNQIQHSELPHWKVDEQNEAWVVEMAKYRSFSWDEEMERLLHIIPVLEYWTNNTFFATDTDNEAVNNDTDHDVYFQKCNKYPHVSDKVQDMKLAREIRRINNNYRSIYEKYKNGMKDLDWNNLRKDVFANGIPLCDDVSKLEKAHSNPCIKYTFRTHSQWKGELKGASGKRFPLNLRRFEKANKPPSAHLYKHNYAAVARKNQVPYVDKSFEHAKNELLSLLKMQGWYGVPRVFGVCLATSDGKDVIKAILKGEESASQPQVLRYLVSRHDDTFEKMCDDYIPSTKCLKAYNILAKLKRKENPPEAALGFMVNLATFFNQFQENRAFLYNLIGEELTHDENFDLMLTGFGTIRFLFGNEDSMQSSNGIDRLLSGTTCQQKEHCAPASWQSNSISYKFGLHCAEVRGFCTSKNRCWGLDSLVHACIISRWLFSQIRTVIPWNWEYSKNLTRIVQCAANGSPDMRCDWPYIKSSLEELHRIAVSASFLEVTVT